MLFKFLKIVPHLLKGNVITLVLVILKLTHVIDWSWWWITTLVWLPVALLISLLLMLPIFAIMGSLFCTSKSTTLNGVTKSYERKNAFAKWQEIPFAD